MLYLDGRLVEVVMKTSREMACRSSVPGQAGWQCRPVRWLACELGGLLVLLGRRMQRFGSPSYLALSEGRASRLARA